MGEKNKGAYDLRAPRVSTAKAIATAPKDTAAYVARCEGAHLVSTAEPPTALVRPRLTSSPAQNGFESFGFLLAAVLLAEVTGVAKADVDRWATVFVAARALYIGVYVSNTTVAVAGVRSLLWFVQIASSFHLGYLAFAARRK